MSAEECLFVLGRGDVSDGSEEAVAALDPVQGKNRVARFMVGISEDAPSSRVVAIRRLNRLPAAVVRMRGTLVATFSLHARRGQIRRIYSVRNPEKLARL